MTHNQWLSIGLSAMETVVLLILLLALNILGSNIYMDSIMIVIITATAVTFYWERESFNDKHKQQ